MDPRTHARRPLRVIGACIRCFGRGALCLRHGLKTGSFQSRSASALRGRSWATRVPSRYLRVTTKWAGNNGEDHHLIDEDGLFRQAAKGDPLPALQRGRIADIDIRKEIIKARARPCAAHLPATHSRLKVNDGTVGLNECARRRGNAGIRVWVFVPACLPASPLFP